MTRVNARPYPEHVAALAREALAEPIANVLRMNGSAPLEVDLVLQDWLEENGHGKVDLRTATGIAILKSIAGEDPEERSIVVVDGVPAWEAACLSYHLVNSWSPSIPTTHAVHFETRATLPGGRRIVESFAVRHRRGGQTARIMFFEERTHEVLVIAPTSDSRTLECSGGWATALPEVGRWRIELRGELVGAR